MKAVILAAGKGTRMGELTKERQKVLLKVKSVDISPLEHDLQNLPDEIDEVFIVVGHKSDEIKESIGQEYAGKKINYVEQKELKGTGHAISLLKDKLKGRFLVIYGDDFYDKRDLDKLVKNDLAILVWEFDENNTQDLQAGHLISDSNGKLTDIVERQPLSAGMLLNTGAYVIDERYYNLPLQKAGNKTDEYGLPQTLVQMADQGIKLVHAENWKKITTPEDLK